MREPHRRSLATLIFPLLLCGCLALGSALGSRSTTHAAAPGVGFAVLDGRTGLLHVTASGLPPNTTVWLVLVAQTIADPALVVQYFKQTTSDDGTIDMDDASGVFICGTWVQLLVRALQPPQVATIPQTGGQVTVFGTTDAASLIVLAHCPATTPIVGITGVTNGVAQVSGQGFRLKETVGISISSALTGFVTGVTTQTDDQGNLALAVPLGAITCPDTLTPHATGLAGSTASGVPFSYSCGAPPTTATPTPATVVARTATPVPVPQGAHLTLTNSPPSILPHGLETVYAATSLPYAVLRAVFTSAGLPPVAFSVRTDNQGNARFPYMAPSHVPAGSHRVHFAVSYTAGSHVLRQTGSFVLTGL